MPNNYTVQCFINSVVAEKIIHLTLATTEGHFREVREN